jgi:hypothetical protein
MKTIRNAVVLAALAGLAALSGNALADDTCPRTPQWGQPPDFWNPDPTNPANARKQLTVRYDGRWAGAAQVPLDNGSSASRARFLEGGDGALYVALELDTTATDREVFWFGWAAANATDSSAAWLLEVSVKPDPNAPQPPPPDLQNLEQQAIRCGAQSCPTGQTCSQTACAGPNLVSYRFLHGVAPTTAGTTKFVWDGIAFDATASNKSWMNPGGSSPEPRAWHGPLYTAATPPSGSTVMLRIPDTAFGGSGPADQKVWVAAASCQFAGNGPVNCMSQGNWPSAGQVTVPDPTNKPDEYEAPAMADWGLMRRVTQASCPVQPELTEAGVQNDAVYDPNKTFTWPQQIYLDNDGNTANDKPNHFAARVAFPIQSDAGKYKARFFVADWGAQIGNLDVSKWFELGSKTNPGTTGPNQTEHLVIDWPPSGTTLAKLKEYACKYSDCYSYEPGCPYPKDVVTDPCAGIPEAHTHHPHQCTQVRLEATGGGGTSSYQFSRDSMIFNSDFVGASVYWRLATISTEGIDAVTPKPLPAAPEGRDIYIYVRPSNLPKTSTEIPTEEIVERIEAIGGAVTAAAPLPPHMRAPLDVVFAKQLREQLGRRDQGNEIDEQRQRSTNEMVRRLPIDTVRMVAPMLEFRVFYDTGRIMDTHPTAMSKWLAPMTSFGYVAEHVGEIQGWEWALDGAEPLGDNWFRIRVKDGEKKVLRTRIQAVDEARMPPGNPVWPPGQAWINPSGIAPGSATVKITKKRGCAVGGGDGAATGVLIIAALAWIARRRRAR